MVCVPIQVATMVKTTDIIKTLTKQLIIIYAVKLSALASNQWVTCVAGLLVSKTKATTASQITGKIFNVCPHVAQLNPNSKLEMRGAIILTDKTDTIRTNKANSDLVRGNFM